MTPVEERIDHELWRLFEPSAGFVNWARSDDDPNASWTTPRRDARVLVERLRALLTEHSAYREALELVEPLIDAQFEGHLDAAEFMEKARKLNVALDTVRDALGYPGAPMSALTTPESPPVEAEEEG